MNVLVDTSVWSLALRRSRAQSLSDAQHTHVSELGELIRTGRAVLTGAIRQELLSGISNAQQFDILRTALGAFESLCPTEEEYEAAAGAFNLCRSKGTQGSNTDFLICALSIQRQLPIFTTDSDFVNFKRHLPIGLYAIQ